MQVFDRRRNIVWSDEADLIAETLAVTKGFKRGVSELLERLVRAESGRKRGTAHLPSNSPQPDSEHVTKRRAPRKDAK
jgi:hypothetical protein